MLRADPRFKVLVTKLSMYLPTRCFVSQSRRRLTSASFSSTGTPATIPRDPRSSINGEVDDSKDDGEESIVLLYQRDPGRNALPRSAFLVSSINSVYWLWYVFDFVPAVNGGPIQELHMDPAFAFAGLGLSVTIQSMFTLYPLSLVSKLGYEPATQRVWLWKHSLPWMKPSYAPLAPIALGDITMDRTSSDTRKILVDLEGDVTKYRGHLGLSVVTSSFPLLVEIQESKEVNNSQRFLEVLLDPQRLKHHRTPGQSYRTSTQRGQPRSPPTRKREMKAKITRRR
jgi:hypothetical protein